jgi:hypothetical protein
MSFSLGMKKSNNMKKVTNSYFDCELPKNRETNVQKVVSSKNNRKNAVDCELPKGIPKGGETNIQKEVLSNNQRKSDFDFEFPKNSRETNETNVQKVALSNNQKKELQDVRSRWQAEDAAAKKRLEAKNKMREEIESDEHTYNSLRCDTNMKNQLPPRNRIITKTSSCRATAELELSDLIISEVSTPNRSAAEALSVSMGKLQSLKSLISSHKLEIDGLKADFEQEKEKILVENQLLINQSMGLREELNKTVAKLDTSRSRVDMLDTDISLLKITNTGNMATEGKTLVENTKFDNEVQTNRPAAEGISSTIERLQSLKNSIASEKMTIENLKTKFKEQEMLFEKEKEKLILENHFLLKESEVQRLDIFTVTEQLIALQLRNDKEIAIFSESAELTLAQTQAHESDMTEMQTRLADLLLENTTCKTEIDRLEAESKKAAMKNKMLVSEIATRNVEVDRLKIEANKSTETLASLKVDWTKQDCSKQTKIEVLEVEKKSLLEQSLKIHSDLNDMTERLGYAQIKVDMGEKNVLRLQDKTANVQSVRVFELQASLTTLEMEIVALKAESREHNGEKEKLANENESLLLQSCRVHAELDHLKEKLTSAQIKIDKGEKEISTLCSLQDEIMNVLSTEESKSELLDLRVNESQESLATSEIEIATLKAESKEKLALEKKSLLDQTQKLRIELDRVTEKLTSTQIKLEKGELEISMLCSLQDKMINVLSVEKYDTEVQNLRVNEPILLQETLALATMNLNKNIESEINQLIEEDVSGSADKLKSLKIFVASHKIEINRLKVESKKHEMTLEMEKEKLIMENKMLKKKSQELELKLDDSREAFRFQLDEVMKDLQASQLRETEVSILEEKVVTIQSSALIEHETYESRVIKMQSSMVGLELEITNSKDHILTTETEIQKLMVDNQLLVDNSGIVISELHELTDKLLASQIRVDTMEREMSMRQVDKGNIRYAFLTCE